MNKSTLAQVRNHLERCNNYFTPKLDTYVNLANYSKRIWSKAERFERFEDNELIGLIAVYDDYLNKRGFITNVSVESKYHGSGMSASLLNECINYFQSKGYNTVDLEVYNCNKKAIAFYEKLNFKILNSNEEKKTTMGIKLERDHHVELKDTKTHKFAGKSASRVSARASRS